MSNLSELLPTGGGQNAVDFVASGTLSSGQTVALKADGTVSVVSATGTSIPESIPAGSEYVYNAAQTNFPQIAFDPNDAGKFVIAYRDAGNSNFGTAIVGTVNGATLSFGAEYVFSGYTNSPSLVFDPNNAGKFVIAYRDNDNSSYGTAIVGTVSGTTISFGSEVVFNSGVTNTISCAYDSLNSKVVIAYTNSSNSGYGTVVIGTISGSAISFGSPVVFESATTDGKSCVFDSTNNKVVIAYDDSGNTSKGTAIVGTVSGTSISFGSPVVFGTNYTSKISMAFDSTTGKVVVAYADYSNSERLTAIVGTVSGTSISFGSIVSNGNICGNTAIAFDPASSGKCVISYKNNSNTSYGTAVTGTVTGTSFAFGSENVFNAGTTDYTAMAFDPNSAGKFLVTYQDGSNSSYGTAVVGQTAATLTNNTDFIGITAEAISDTATGAVNVYGGINEAQSGLTIGSDYYVQADGSLSTTASSVKVGKAISATTINMMDLT